MISGISGLLLIEPGSLQRPGLPKGLGYNVALPANSPAGLLAASSGICPHCPYPTRFLENMTSILKLRGAPALSSSRLERLSRAVGEVLPKLAGLAAEHWYFVEVSSALDEAELARLGLSEVPDLALRVRRAYEQRAERAKALLPTLLGCTTPQECRQTLAEKRTKLPPQVLPIGWRVHR